MASGRRGQNEITLGAGHVVGMFLAVVVLCAIFFTLGYVMGRGESAVKVADAVGNSPGVDAQGNPTAKSRAPASTGWDFFPKKSSSPDNSSGGASPGLISRPSAAAHPASSGAAPRSPSRPISMSPKHTGLRVERNPPPLPNGREGILLQVAAMANRGDALALTGFLKQKGYPAFAWGPSSDRLYRVQVGPYSNSKAAGVARAKLEKEGFKSILKK